MKKLTSGGIFKALVDPANLSGLFTPKVAAPDPIPPIPEPAVAPVPDDQALKAKKRREFARTRQRSGRLSTINTAPQGTVLG